MTILSAPPGEATYLSVLTAESRGAIAVLRVWGRNAVVLVDVAFRPLRGATFRESTPAVPRVGRIGAGTGDEVVAVIVEEPGRPAEVEIQCHGGPAAVSLVVGAMEALGVSRRSPEIWLESHSRSRLQSQARFDLGFAETTRVAEILLDQAAGALDRTIARLADRVAVDPGGSIEELTALIHRAEVGLRLVTGWRVVLTGRPNVGKSRLLNALAGFGRAIVSPTPGTTRDVVTVKTAIDGWPVELADTAGVRSTTDPIESGGVDLARAELLAADLVLLVLDGSDALTEADRSLMAEHPDAILACNKADLPAAWNAGDAGRDVAIISAERGDGLDVLLDRISQRLVPNPPRRGIAVPFRAEQERKLGRVLRILNGGRPEAEVAAQALLSLM